MYKLKKTDSKELQITITVLLVAIMLLIPIAYILQIFGALGQFSVGISEIVLVIGAIILLVFDIMFLMQKENRKLDWFDIVLLLNAVSLVLSAVFADNTKLALAGQGLSGEGLWVMLSYLIIAFSVSTITDSRCKKGLYIGSVVFGLIQVVMGLFETIIMIEPFRKLAEEHVVFSINRALGTVKNPNPYGSLMLILACVESGLTFGCKELKKKILHGILTFLYVLCIFLSATRGAILGYFVAAFVFSIWIIVNGKKNGSKIIDNVKKLLVVLAIVLASVGAVAVTGDTISDTISRTDTDLSEGRAGEDRLDIWQICFDGFLDSPVIGRGLSNIDISFFSIPDTEESYDIQIISTRDAHNRYINILATQGIVGLIAYVLLIITVLIRGFRILKTSSYENNAVMLGMMMAIIGYLVADVFCIGMYGVVCCFYLLLGSVYKRGVSNVGRAKEM